jgi:DNA polymerase III delta prime subunit
MNVNEKYKNVEDGEPIQISEKLTVVFYNAVAFYNNKESRKEYYGYVNKQIESGNRTLFLRMHTNKVNIPKEIAETIIVNIPKEIAETIVEIVKNNPLNLSFFITIVYNSEDEKKNIISDIRLGLKENEVLENLKRIDEDEGWKTGDRSRDE